MEAFVKQIELSAILTLVCLCGPARAQDPAVRLQTNHIEGPTTPADFPKWMADMNAVVFSDLQLQETALSPKQILALVFGVVVSHAFEKLHPPSLERFTSHPQPIGRGTNRNKRKSQPCKNSKRGGPGATHSAIANHVPNDITL